MLRKAQLAAGNIIQIRQLKIYCLKVVSRKTELSKCANFWDNANFTAICNALYSKYYSLFDLRKSKTFYS